MPALPINNRVADEAIAMLRSGAPVVLPLPSPLAYVVTGTDAAAVNTAKGRPAAQAVGVSVADLDVIAAYLDVATGVLPPARWLCESELVSLLVPVLSAAPAWLAPAISDGMVFFTSAPWLPELNDIIITFGHLYMSSANVTAGRPAETAAEAVDAFGDERLVLDGDLLRDRSAAHGSTTIVRLSTTGQLSVARSGINNAAFGADSTGYVADLFRRWQTANANARR